MSPLWPQMPPGVLFGTRGRPRLTVSYGPVTASYPEARVIVAEVTNLAGLQDRDRQPVGRY